MSIKISKFDILIKKREIILAKIKARSEIKDFILYSDNLEIYKDLKIFSHTKSVDYFKMLENLEKEIELLLRSRS